MSKLLSLLRNPKGLYDSFIILSYRIRRIIYQRFYSHKYIYIIKKDIKDLLLNDFQQVFNDKEKKDILSYADEIVSNVIILFGKKYKFNFASWNIDLISKYRWPQIDYWRIKLKKEIVKADVKFPWEISRLHTLIPLAYAFKISNNQKYIDKYTSILESWIDENPINIGVNWSVSMEVSIRAINIIQSFLVLKFFLNKKIQKKINNTLYQHYIYIYNNLEKGINTNNHYLSNLSGLIWLSIYFNKSKSLNFAVKELNKELNHQVYNDGFSYEDSIAYHALNTEMLVFTMIFMQMNDVSCNNSISHTIKKMVIALDKLSSLDGKIPLIGDMDSGRLLILNDFYRKEKQNFAFLLSLSSTYFKEKKILNIDTSYSKLIFENTANNTSKTKRKKTEYLYDAGIYILRNDIFECTIKCSKLGVNGVGGHSHNDQLSILLNVKNNSFFIDSGTGEYTRNYETRNELRKTSAHNTVVVDCVEQNNFIKNDGFKVENNFEIINNNIQDNDFNGSIKYIKENISHDRSIQLIHDTISIVDKVKNAKENKAYVNFILDPSIEIRASRDIVHLKSVNNSIKIYTLNNEKIEIKKTRISEGYGEFRESSSLRFYFNNDVCNLTIKSIN